MTAAFGRFWAGRGRPSRPLSRRRQSIRSGRLPVVRNNHSEREEYDQTEVDRARTRHARERRRCSLHVAATTRRLRLPSPLPRSPPRRSRPRSRRPSTSAAEPAAGGTTLQGSVGPGFTISLHAGRGRRNGARGRGVHDRGQRPGRRSQLPSRRSGSGRVDGRRRGHRDDVRGDARARRVHVRLRPSREPDGRDVHGLLACPIRGPRL